MVDSACIYVGFFWVLCFLFKLQVTPGLPVEVIHLNRVVMNGIAIGLSSDIIFTYFILHNKARLRYISHYNCCVVEENDFTQRFLAITYNCF